MATGFSISIEGGHDVIYDYCCTTCASKNLNAEALFYCKDCSKLFCDSCERYHDKFTKGHGVLGRKEVANWGNVKPVTTSFMCEEHPGKELEMYCGDHDCLCCHTCISVKHRACKIVKPVSEVSKGIQTDPDFVALMSKATKTQSRLKKMRDSHESTIKLLHEFREEITITFHDMRKRFNQILDRLEECSTKEMDSLIEMLEEQVNLDKHICSEFYDNIHKLLDDIRSLGKQCNELAFQGYKKCSEQMASAGKLLSDLENVDYQVKFIPDAMIEQYLSSIEKLGTFYVSPSGIAHVDKLNTSKLAKPLTPPDHVYSVIDKQTYNVKTKSDPKPGLISGICQVTDGQIVIADYENTKVKLLSKEYSVIDELGLPPKPCDICHTTGLEVAVTVSQSKDNKCVRKEIHLISIARGKLSHTRTVKTDHECGGIAYHNALLYVGSSNAIHIYNLSGKIVKKLYENNSGNVYRFSISDDGSKIYVTDRSNYILHTIDSRGNQLSTLSGPELQYPRGICLAENGSVFVCFALSNTVLQVDREGGKKMATLATEAQGVSAPMSLCYDKQNRRLLVGYIDLLVLQLK